MLDAEWSVEEVAEVALVEVSVHNPTAVDRRVRVENQLDGPTLPPRTEGVPERGWNEDGYAGVVQAGERLRLGYASPAPAADPPVTVEDEGRADGDATGRGDEGADAAAALRVLGDAAPPVDALPAVEGEGNAGEETRTPTPAEATAGQRGGPEGSTVGATDAEVSASVGPGGDAPAAGARRSAPEAPDPAPSSEGTVAGGSAGDAPTNGTLAGSDEALAAASGDAADGSAGEPADGEACGETPPFAGAGTGGSTGEDAPGLETEDGEGPGDERRDAGPETDSDRREAGDGVDAGRRGAGRRPDAGRSEAGQGADAEGGDSDGVDADGNDRTDLEVPPPVAEWLTDVERRIAHAERLTDASVVEAAAVLDERGGLGAVESLPERVATDEAALRALAERATALADRAAATDVPLAALRRLS